MITHVGVVPSRPAESWAVVEWFGNVEKTFCFRSAHAGTSGNRARESEDPAVPACLVERKLQLQFLHARMLLYVRACRCETSWAKRMNVEFSRIYNEIVKRRLERDSVGCWIG